MWVNTGKDMVSTRSRPKAAGWCLKTICLMGWMFQLAAARRRLANFIGKTAKIIAVSTRSRPKAAGAPTGVCTDVRTVSTRSRPKAAGCFGKLNFQIIVMFQLAAARRRLEVIDLFDYAKAVFQLAAARRRLVRRKER